MAKAYAINYDLRAPGRDYSGLYEAIKKYTNLHPVESTWLVVTNESASDIWNRISKHLDKNDLALIIDVRKNYYGVLPKEAWDWIERNVPL